MGDRVTSVLCLSNRERFPHGAQHCCCRGCWWHGCHNQHSRGRAQAGQCRHHRCAARCVTMLHAVLPVSLTAQHQAALVRAGVGVAAAKEAIEQRELAATTGSIRAAVPQCTKAPELQPGAPSWQASMHRTAPRSYPDPSCCMQALVLVRQGASRRCPPSGRLPDRAALPPRSPWLLRRRLVIIP